MNWGVSELLKGRLNLARGDNLFFWRDTSSGGSQRENHVAFHQFVAKQHVVPQHAGRFVCRG